MLIENVINLLWQFEIYLFIIQISIMAAVTIGF